MKHLFSIALLWCVALAVQADTNSFTYYVNDAVGSPVVAMNQTGDVVWRKTYQPYGKTSGKDGDNRVGYTGHVEDKPDLVYAGARYYDPTLGRFLSDDPVRFIEKNPMSFNRYAYANNNPYKFVDPDGRENLILEPHDDKSYAADNWYNNSKFYTVGSHGSKDDNNHIMGRDGKMNMTPQDVARAMIEDGYDGSKTVELVICYAGKGGKDSFAQKLANELAGQLDKSVEVKAYSGKVRVNGNIFGGHVDPKASEWTIFQGSK